MALSQNNINTLQHLGEEGRLKLAKRKSHHVSHVSVVVALVSYFLLYPTL